jgi:hypothetical protein
VKAYSTKENARHLRVMRKRGKARQYLCDGCCGSAAQDWARLHDRSGLDPFDYVPLCRRCHWHYDEAAHRPNVTLMQAGHRQWRAA